MPNRSSSLTSLRQIHSRPIEQPFDYLSTNLRWLQVAEGDHRTTSDLAWGWRLGVAVELLDIAADTLWSLFFKEAINRLQYGKKVAYQHILSSLELPFLLQACCGRP